MDAILGEIDAAALDGEPALALQFDLRRMPVRWALCAIIADFYSEYLVAQAESGAARPDAEQRHTISYVINELVENAVKFNSGPRIGVSVTRTPKGLVFTVRNGVKLADIDKVKASFTSLLAGEPGELLLRRIEQNAMGGGGGSGIGYLTLMSDYGVKLGWRFEADADEPGMITLSTVAQLSL
jgi:hypothetical protein